jgi:hypothetical protein
MLLGTVDNTPENVLGAGLTEEQLLNAVKQSGYPLQTQVANELRKREFVVSPEWSFIDRDTNELRAIDIRASLALWDYDKDPRVRPHLELVIECKQSLLPFVFFTGEEMQFRASLPFLAGLLKDKIEVYTDDSGSAWIFPIGYALGFSEQPFYKLPPVGYTFSKAVRNGNKVSLSGQEPYQQLILPLVKAASFLAEKEAPPETYLWFDAYLTVLIAVVDAPMSCAQGEQIKMTPWVRVLRHENVPSEASDEASDAGRLWVIDVVHKSFFPKYLDEHLLPFGRHCGDAVLRHEREVAEGVGFAPKMDKNGEGPIEPLLKPLGKSPVPPEAMLSRLRGAHPARDKDDERGSTDEGKSDGE